jgi:protein TonB
MAVRLMILVLAVCGTLVGCAGYTVAPPIRSEAPPLDTSDASFAAPDGAEFVEDYDRAPIIVEQHPPEYPEAARAAGVQGVVELLVGVNEKGAVVEATVVTSVPGLSRAAVEAVRTWRFRPAERGGEPVAVRIPIPVRFTLRG